MKRLFLSLLLGTAMPAFAQLTFDAATGTTGVQNGAGTWDTTTSNWWDSTLNANTVWNNGIAQFGSTASAVGGTITINTAITATGLNFLPLSAAPTATNQAYHFSGTGSLTLTGSAPIINIGNNATSGSNTSVSGVNFFLPVTASDLIIQKSSGTGIGFARFPSVNPGLTGVMTLKGASGGIFLGYAANSFPNLTALLVESNSVAQLIGTDAVYPTAFRIAGTGGTTNWGAIRMDSSVTLSGGITLVADARVHTHTNVINSFITAPITESGGSFAYTRTAILPTTATGPLSLTYTAANNYTGVTNFGRLVAAAYPALPVASEGGLNVLDFSAAGAPVSNIFYNGVATNALNLFGGHGTTTTLRLKGKDNTVNSQTFGDVAIAQNRSEIELISGTGGTVNLTLGALTRTGNGVLAIKAPVSGSITTTTVTPFLGAWATYTAADGKASWAGAATGTIGGFTGDTDHASATPVLSTTAANLRVGVASTGDVTLGDAVTGLNTVSMTDTWVGRTLDIGSGQTLRLGAAGGIQVVSDAQALTVSGGKLTAGGTDNTAGQLLLTNLSATAPLTINSVIDNNGTGALTVLLNGTGTTVFTNANTYTGNTVVDSGSLEIRHGSALGTTAGFTQVMTDASVMLSGGITTGEQFILSGRGQNLAGALRNLSGTNTITSQTVGLMNIRINSDAGELILAPTGGLTANAITGTTLPITFGGAGNITVNGRINNTSGAITKDGTGTLVLAADNPFTGVVTVSAGTLRITHNNALGTVGTSSNTVVSAGGTLELAGGITTPETMTVSGIGVNSQGAIRSVSGINTLAGQVTVGSATLRFQADAGSTLNFDVTSGNSFVHQGSAVVTATFGGSGTIIMADPMVDIASGSGTLGIFKTGEGTMHVRSASPTLRGITTLNGGVLNLDYSATTTTGNMLGTTTAPVTFNGGALQITGRSGASVTQSFGNITIASGSSELNVVQNGGTAVNIALGTISRLAAVGVLQINPGTGTLTTTGGADNAVLMNDNIPYATIGTNDWAATGAISGGVRNIVGLSTISGGYTPTSGGTLAGHADVNTATVSVAASTTTNSLRFNTSGGSTLTIASGQILTTGGILVGANAGSSNVVITGGTLRSGSTNASPSNADLVVIQNNTAAGLVISSVIANNATASSNTGFTKAGPGTVYFDTVNHTYSGTTRVLEGTLHVRSGNISANSEITLGAGSKSGVLKLGNGTTSVSMALDWLRIEGTGTGNAVVGGSSNYSTFMLDNSTVASDFRNGKLGGSGEFEDNLNFMLTAGGSLIATLGADNTYNGKTTLQAGTIEATLLADRGLPSSIGRGDRNDEAAIIDMSSATVTGAYVQAISTLRYIGSTDSSTNRPIRILNNDVIGDTYSVVTVLENTGTGSVKFTAPFTSEGTNTAPRTLRLMGTNTGANEIVSVNDLSETVLTSLEKQGTGTWIITGDSTHTGTTTVANGVLQLGKGGTTGSVASPSIVLSSATAILSTNRSDDFTLSQAITGTGTLRINNPTGGITRLTSDANTYGATLVQSGTLLVNNASSASSGTGLGSVTVSPGAVLGGTGRLAPVANGSITIIAGTLSIGDPTVSAAAALTLATSGTGSLSLQSGAAIAFDLFGGLGAGENSLSGTAADRAIILGAVTLGTDITLRVSNLSGSTSFAANDSWKIFDWSGITGTFTHYELPTLTGGLQWDLSNLYTTGMLSIVVVPEPSRMLLLALAAGYALSRRHGGWRNPK